MAITITTNQQVALHVAALDPTGKVPPNPAPTWTTSHPTKVGLAFPQGDTNTCIVIGLATQAGVTVTATSGVLTQVFTIDVVSPAITALTGSNDLPVSQSDLNRSRGRGLGLGYL
jgi:hypothetical protein